MKKRLTKRAVDSASPKAGKPVFIWDTEVTGFGLKVTPTGRKNYLLQYRTREQGGQDTPKRITLGRHGRELTLDQARRLAASLLLEVKAGKDPATTWRTKTSPTVADLADRFLTEHLPAKKRPPRARTIASYESLLRCHVLPTLGAKKVAAVTNSEIERLHLSMRDTPYAANRVLTVLGQAFDQAERWSWREPHSNPTRHVERYREEKRGAKREVMLSPEQMKAVFEAIEEEEKERTGPYSCGAIRLAFWTGWRIGEVLSLAWENLDLESGRARLVKTKTAEEEYRMLPAQAIEIIESMPRLASSAWVFPGRDPRDHLTSVRKPWSRIRRRAGIDDLEGLGAFRIHDLRHNIVSWDVSRGVPLEIAGKNVGHRSRASTEVYAHFAPSALKQAADERATAMQEAAEGS